MFNHFLLCRYNLALYSSNPYNVQDKDAWMVERLPMFKRLLDSLEAQTNKDFVLIFSIDAFTPKHFQVELAELLNTYSFKWLGCTTQPREFIQTLKIEREWMITSRIDNDDEYYPKFIETIQNSFQSKREVLDVKGVQFDGKDYYKTNRRYPNSPFISLVELSKERKTAQYRAHTSMNKFAPARFVSNETLYIQHIHDNNVINKISGIKL
jgi:hypothetical protein